MKPVNLKNINYRDEIARRQRRIFIIKVVFGIIGIGMAGAGLVYFLFFSRLFDVREISFNGLDTVSSDEFQRKIDEKLNQKILKYLPRRNNIFFVSTRNFETEFTSAYPIFKSVSVQKKLLHGLVFNFSERKPAGIWCFNLQEGGSCSYFDENKVLWGQPAKSSGFIFLTVDDQRDRNNRQIDEEFFKPITEVAKNMSGEINNIVIPRGSFNEFRVNTAQGYYLLFVTDSDIHPERGREGSQRDPASYGIQNQLDILKIFIDDKIKNSLTAGVFHPQYIDLRIDGRVYYK